MTSHLRPSGGGPEPSVAYEAARLRWAQPGDADALGALWREARPEGNAGPTAMRDWIEHGGAMLLEDPAGRLLCALRWREEPGGWRVDRIATVPDARGQGYGRWLMTMVEALAIRHNIPQLTLQLDRPDLLPYYRRLGYRHSDPSAANDADGGSPLTLSKRVGGTWQVQDPQRSEGAA